VIATSNAKVVLTSGDNLDKWMAKVAGQAGGHPAVVDVGAAVPFRVAGEASGPEASKYDPHWWHDPRNAVAAVERIRAAFASAIPSHASDFARNARAYVQRLRTLDRGIARCFASVAPRQR